MDTPGRPDRRAGHRQVERIQVGLRLYWLQAYLLIYTPIGLFADSRVTAAWQQYVLGLLTFLVLYLAALKSPREQRAQVWTCVAVATCFEIFGSLVWGIYQYRLHNLPLFVPPGHGIVYLFGLLAAQTPVVMRYGRKVAYVVLAAAGAWALAGVTVLPIVTGRVDVQGALCLPVFAYFLLRSPRWPLFAAIFIIGQSDYRRLLAYSSVEHMGILVFGLGFGIAGAQGALLHVLSNALAKGVLFLVAGNVLQICGTSAMGSIAGLLRRAPATGVLLVIGLFAGLGLPPFGLFISEFTILRAALAGGASAWPAALYLGFLAIIFLGMCAAVLPMAQGESATQPASEPWTTTLPPAIFAAAALVLGVYIPAPIAQVIKAATLQLGAG